MIDAKNIKIDEHGIDLKYNGITKNHIEYSNIKKGLISKQRLRRFWYFPVLIGFLFLTIGIVWFFKITLQFDWSMMFHVNIYKPLFLQLFSPIIFGILGTMIIIGSIKKDWIFILQTKDKKTRRIDIADIQKSGQLDYFYVLLDKHLN